MWLLLAFTSALLLGLYDVAKKQALRDNAVLPVLLLNTLFSSLLFLPTILSTAGGWGWFDATPLRCPAGDLHAHLLVVLKSCIVLSSWVFGYFGIKHLPLTIVGPINATRPVMTLVGAMLIFGERLNGYQWVGVVLVGLTPNRVDAASHIGVARDLAAYLRAKGDAEARVLWPDVSAFAVDDHALEIGVTVENAEAAPRYTGVTITGCKIGPSPEWMQNALRAAGIHPKNNLVDITNYVLFELGQPLHAFDARKIEGRRIVVKTCAEGTPFVTLDGVERKLSDRDLMICSAERPMCIGGVFGGLASGVGDDTTDIFLESAYFNPVWVRKTAKRHGLNTDSSWRFERGVDPRLQVYALKRAALLFKELAGGRISSDIVEVSAGEPADFVFDFSPARSNALIGKELSEQTYRTILDALDVKILGEREREGVWRVAVPPYRVDVQREADLVEEVLRIYGYNNVEIPVQVRSTLSYAAKPDRNRLMNLAADYLTAGGFTEIMSNSLTKESYYEGLTSYPAARCVRILNPLSADLNVMRQTLLFNMLEAVQLNANRATATSDSTNSATATSTTRRRSDAEKPAFGLLRGVPAGDRRLLRGADDGAQRPGAAPDRLGGPGYPPPDGPQAGGLLSGDEFRRPRAFDPETPHRRRGAVEVPRGEARSGAADRQTGNLLGAA